MNEGKLFAVTGDSASEREGPWDIIPRPLPV